MPAADPMGKALTAEAVFDPVEPNKTVEVKVEFPAPDLASCGWHATYTATYCGLAQTLEDDLLPVRNWQVVGPSPMLGQGIPQGIEPEKGVDAKAAYTVGHGEPLRWQPARS